MITRANFALPSAFLLLLSACGGGGGSSQPPVIAPPTPVLPIGVSDGGSGVPNDPLQLLGTPTPLVAEAQRGLEVINISGFVPFANSIESNPQFTLQQTTTGFEFREQGNALTSPTDNTVQYDTRPGSRHIKNLNSFENCIGSCAGLGQGLRPVLFTFNGGTPSTLSHTVYGVWAQRPLVGYVRFGVFAVGNVTSSTQMPTTGTASFTGTSAGYVYDTLPDEVGFTGAISMTANFTTGDIVGAVTDIRTTALASGASGTMSNINLTAGRISGTDYAGNAAAGAPLPGATYSIAGATGRFGGRFFGPNAAETGGSYTLQNATINLIGSFGAKR